MSDYYTEKDSKEVMDVLYKKIKEQICERQPMLCTDAEYFKFEQAGCDMSEYMTIRQMERIVRDNQLKEMKEKQRIMQEKKEAC